MAATEEISIDTATVTIQSETDGIHTLKESRKNQLNAFPGEPHCNIFLTTGFQRGDEQLMLPLAPTGSFTLKKQIWLVRMSMRDRRFAQSLYQMYTWHKSIR